MEKVREKQHLMKSMGSTTTDSNKWGTELPEDIMKLILGKLVFVDQARFRAVCRRWRQKHKKGSGDPLPPPVKQLPWQLKVLLCSDDQGYITQSFKLFDPVSKMTWEINKTLLSKVFDLQNLCNWHVQVWASKEDWLLISDTESVESRTTNYYFYNPFSLEKLGLPSRDFLPNSATCSSPPTSSDCTIFLSEEDHGTIHISTCHPDDTTWVTANFDDCFLVSRSMVYADGILYCACLYGDDVVAVNLREKTHTRLVHLVYPNPFDALLIDYWRIQLVESRGEFLVLYPIYNSVGNSVEEEELSAFKLIDGAWVRMESLGNRALFTSFGYSISIEVSETASKTGEIQADGVYDISSCYPLSFYPSKKNNNRNYQSESETYPLPMEGEHLLYEGYVQPPTLNYY